MLDKVLLFPLFWYVSEIAGYKNLDMCKYTLKAICTNINGVRETRQMFHFCKRNYLFYKVFFFCFFLRSVVCPNGFQLLCFVSSWIPLSGFSNVYGIDNKWLYLYIFSLIFSCCDIYYQATRVILTYHCCFLIWRLHDVTLPNPRCTYHHSYVLLEMDLSSHFTSAVTKVFSRCIMFRKKVGNIVHRYTQIFDRLVDFWCSLNGQYG